MYLGEPLFDRHELAVRAGGHVAVGQRAEKAPAAQARTPGPGPQQVRVRRLRRWRRSDGRPAGTAWRRRAGRRAGNGRRRVRAGPSHQGRVRSRCRAATRQLPADRRPRREQVARLRARAATPWTCAQRRGRDSWRSARASCCAHDASVVMRPRLDSRGGTFTDVACCLKTSCSALRPVIRRCWPERGGLADTRDSSGIRRYRSRAHVNARIGLPLLSAAPVPGPVAVAACTVGEVTGERGGITPRARTMRHVEHR